MRDADTAGLFRTAVEQGVGGGMGGVSHREEDKERKGRDYGRQRIDIEGQD